MLTSSPERTYGGNFALILCIKCYLKLKKFFTNKFKDLISKMPNPCRVK